MVTRQEVLQLLDYNPETGSFRWKTSVGRVSKGSIAGCVHSDNYAYIGINRKHYLSHRLAWLVCKGSWPAADIDHINGVKSDNRISNLRAVSKAENQQAIVKAQKNNVTGLAGVSPCHGKFLARIVADGVLHRLGRFDTPEQARAAYLKAKQKLHPTSNLSKPYISGTTTS